LGIFEATLTALSPRLHRSQLATGSAELLQMIAQDRTRLMVEAAAKSGVPIHPCADQRAAKIMTPDVTVCSDNGKLQPLFVSLFSSAFAHASF